MAIYTKQSESIDEADLQALITSADSESKRIEYKATLPDNQNSNKKEFLRDVSSFANAVGGDLVYGMKTIDGIPTELCGVEIASLDAEKLRLEQIIRDGIRPRINISPIHTVALQNGRQGLIIRVRRGFAPPHQVVFDRDYRFYTRDTNGRHTLDVDELRVAFDLLGTTAQRIRDFRAERLVSIIAGQTPVPLTDNPKIVLHIVSFGGFDPGARLDLLPMWDANQLNKIHPVSTTYGTSDRWNLDGILRWNVLMGDTKSSGYVQLFRNGTIEAVDAKIIQLPWPDTPGLPYIMAEDVEDALCQVLPGYLAAQESIGVEPPILIMLTILGVSGHVVAWREGGVGREYHQSIDKNDLLTPEIQLDSFACDPKAVLKPAFDAIANAGGLPYSRSYDAEGSWLRGE
jgi:hypothetical protein